MRRIVAQSLEHQAPADAVSARLSLGVMRLRPVEIRGIDHEQKEKESVSKW